MKKSLRMLAVVAVVAGAAVAIAAYSANSLVQRFKPEIERAAGNALQASVSFGRISVSVFPSVKLQVEEARITAQPGGADTLSLKGLVLHVKLLPLLARRVVVETVSLDEPSFTVVKAKDGVFIQGLPRPHPATRLPPQHGPGEPAPVPSSSEQQAPPVGSALSIDLRKFEITDAAFTLRDAENHEELSLENINLTAALSMHESTAMVSRLALRADIPHAQQISVNGSGQRFDLRTGELTLGALQANIPGGVVTLTGTANVRALSGNITISSDGIKLDDVVPLVGTFTAAASGVNLRGTVKPHLNASVTDASVTPGTYTASGNVELQGISFQRGTFSVADLSGPLALVADNAKQTVTTDGLSFVFNGKPGTIKCSAVADGNTVRLEPLALSALAGSLSGTVEGSLSPPNRFGARVEGSGFSVADLQALSDPRAPMRMEGVVSKLALDVRGQVQGDIERSLAGTASVGMQHGVLKGFNLAEAVLKGAQRVPLLAAAVDVPRFKKYFASKNTEIQSLTGDFTIRSGWAETHNLRLESEPFTLVGSGRVSFQTDVNLVATITFNAELSQVMIGRAKELRPMLNSDGTLSIPVAVDGRPPNLDARPDLAKLIEASTKNVLEGKVGKALEKALGSEEKKGGKLLEQLLGK